ncbi:hypothetical protein RHMOL_Rhmol05G0021800 [Rhododendron molle]|uniref:Uncharacterized protein n=1 Tax=Rhododendron molle TaxID=49168 RepID=A0ACC0NLR1_RHOML|nr:hypothetical protein RHMOL_Rhmol05G0021800 [Rhododendron molle]
MTNEMMRRRIERRRPVVTRAAPPSPPATHRRLTWPSPSLCRRSISTSPISVAAVAVKVSDSPDLSRRRQDPRSAVRGGGVGGGAVSGDDAGCYSRFRVGTGSWST